MPSPKARYNGPISLADLVKSGKESPLPDFSDDLRQALRGFYPGGNAAHAEHDPAWGSPVDAFVSEILAEAGWAISELEEMRLSLAKQDLRAECNNLRTTLEGTRDKLRTLSPDLDRLLGVDADPLGCADWLDALIQHVNEADRLIGKLPTKTKAHAKRHEIAIEMAIRVLRVAKKYGMEVSASGSSHFPDSVSQAPRLLKAIGDDIGLRFAELTWRNHVAEAKRKAGDL